MMSGWIPDGWHSITPRLVADNPERLVRFLKDAFGATGSYSTSSPTQMRIGDSIVMISAAGLRGVKSALLHLYVEDADAVYQRAIAAGAVSVEAPADMPYGDRRAMVEDPCGNQWQIATYRDQEANRPAG